PLEFLLCLTGTKEYESLLRSRAKPSHVHLALLMIGVKPGKPARFDEQANRMLPPEGSPVKLSCTFERDGKTVSFPATRLMRNQKTRAEMADTPWVFAGSRFTEQGDYLADVSGETISVVNFPHAVLDVPMVRSSRNESLEWVSNPDLAPKRDTKVWLLIEPADAHAGGH
ncbi:MAG: YdjY domain-containing protein, partial [Tepidisphaeraceae bacterium]